MEDGACRLGLARRAFRQATVAFAVFAAAGLLVLVMHPPLLAMIDFYLFARNDTGWLIAGSVVLAVALPVGGLLARYPWRVGLPKGRWPVMVIAGLVVVTGVVGHWGVFGSYPVAMDEFMARFQASMFLAGSLIATLPEEWAEYARALQPIFIGHDLQLGIWSPDYRPGNAAIIALFESGGLAALAQPLMAGGSVVLVARFAHRLWPDERCLPILAAILLATSPQLLITAMTPYSMTAHLFFNLAWLAMFLKGGRWGHSGAVSVGFIAIGLHQIHLHPAFVAPFMLSLLAQRRFRLAALYAGSYSVFLVFWLFWRDVAMFLESLPQSVGVGDGGFLLEGVVRRLASHSLLDPFFWMSNLGRLFAWQNLALFPLLFIALGRISRMPWLIRMLAWGCLTSLVPYILLMPNQGHGWGYRYLHVCLGSLVLIAIYGWQALTQGAPREFIRQIGASLVFAAAIGTVFGLPWRAVQAQRFTQPLVEAQALVEQLPVDVVIIDTNAIWYGVDLVRNDPLVANTPRLMALEALTAQQLTSLCRQHEVAIVTYGSLSLSGIRPSPDWQNTNGSRRTALADQLTAADCPPALPPINR